MMIDADMKLAQREKVLKDHDHKEQGDTAKQAAAHLESPAAAGR
jgi:hypothetical protein